MVTLILMSEAAVSRDSNIYNCSCILYYEEPVTLILLNKDKIYTKEEFFGQVSLNRAVEKMTLQNVEK